MKMSTPQQKAQCVSWFIETKSDIQAQQNFSRMSDFVSINQETHWAFCCGVLIFINSFFATKFKILESYHIKHQHQETVNHSEHSFVHCCWLHTRHKHSRPAKKTSVLPMGTHLKRYATHPKQMIQTQTHPLPYLNAQLDPQINLVIFKFKKIYC